MRKKLFMIFILAALFMGFNAGAATLSDFTSGDMELSRSGLEPVHNYTPFIQYRQFDFGNASLQDGSGVTNNDVVRLFNVTENTIIVEIGVRVTTAALYSGCSAEIGDGTNIDGFVGNDYTAWGVPYIDLSTVSSGISRWQLLGPNLLPSGVTVADHTTNLMGALVANQGPFFYSGGSPYIGADTIDMTVYTNSTVYDTGNASGVTPVIEVYIKGFKRVVP